MVDINDDTKRVRGRVVVRSGIIRRRRWTAEEKGRIVAEAVRPGGVIAEVARRHDLTPQHLSNWIRAAKDGHFAIPAEESVTFVPLVTSGPVGVAASARSCERPACAKPELRFGEGRTISIEITVGSVLVRVADGADASTLEAVMGAVMRAAA